MLLAVLVLPNWILNLSVFIDSYIVNFVHSDVVL